MASAVQGSVNANDTCTAVTLFTTLIASMLNKSLEQNLNGCDHCDRKTNYYDFIVIGAGTAGSILAKLLTDNPSWQVLVLEAGTQEVPIMDVPSFAGLIDPSSAWNLTAKTSIGDRHLNNVGKVTGGTSALNDMYYTRGTEKDYQDWVTNHGATGWSYDDLIPYFVSLENYLDKQDPKNPIYSTLAERTIPYSAAFAKAGLAAVNTTEEVHIGFTQPLFTIKGGQRQDTYDAFLQPAQGRTNLCLKLKSHVTKILTNLWTKQAYGVKYMDENGNPQTALALLEVILSAGVYHSPQLLMLSGIGPKSTLQALNISVVSDLPVGQRLQQQVDVNGVFSFSVPQKQSPSPSTEKMTELNLFVTNNTGPLSVPTTFLSCYESFLGDPSQPEVQYLGKTLFSSSNCANNSYESTFFNKNIFNAVLLHPNGTGNVTLKDSNPMSDPVISSGLLEDPQDVNVLVNAMKTLYNMSKAVNSKNASFDGLNVPACTSLLSNMDSYWKCVVQNFATISSGATSSCPIGSPKDPYAVVDPQLRVYGVEGLRVVDASVMPSPVSGDPTGVVAAIAAKAADLIKSDWAYSVENFVMSGSGIRNNFGIAAHEEDY